MNINYLRIKCMNKTKQYNIDIKKKRTCIDDV